MYLSFDLFQSVHPYKNNDFENALNDGKQNVGIKKQCFGLETDQTTKPLHQLTLERCGSDKEGVTQHKLNDLLLKFIVSNTQPLSVVNKPSFVNLVRLGLPKDLKVMSSKNLKLQIEKLYLSMVDNITDTLSSVLYVSTTADCWTKGKKSYIGVTCHWINSKSFKRESVSLACCRIKVHHTMMLLLRHYIKSIQHIKFKTKLFQQPLTMVQTLSKHLILILKPMTQILRMTRTRMMKMRMLTYLIY